MDINPLVVLIIILGYFLTFLSSTIIVRLSVNKLKKKQKLRIDFDTGFIIGLCENFIILTFVLMNEIIGLALVFAAKTIVRRKDIEKDPKYYLVGTMINFTYSVFMAVLLKITLKIIS